MSFATCCPSCGTTFRVVRDQLKVSEGWVRCGRCGEVFCALDGLFELGRDEPAAQEAAREPETLPPGSEAAVPAPESASRQEPAPAPEPEPEPERAGATSAPAPWVAPAAAAAPPRPAFLEPAPGPSPESQGPPPAPETIGLPPPSEPAIPETGWRAEPEPEPEPERGDGMRGADGAAAQEPEAIAVLAPPEPAPGLQPAPPRLPQAPAPEPAHQPSEPLPAPEPRPEDEGPRTVEPAALTMEDGFATAPAEDASLLRRTRRSADEEDGATSADVLDSRFFEDEERPELAWPPRPDRRADEADDFADARFSSTLEEADLATGAEPPEAAAPAAATVAPSPIPLESEQVQPGFLQQAQRRERLSRPAVRAAMGGFAAVLGLALLAQVAIQQREWLAAEWPATRPGLQAWCGWTGCELGPLKRIEDVVLDHSALADAGKGRPGYRLNLLLRNRGDASVALPALELTLTDTSGRLVARRVLRPADFPQAPPAIAPRAQLALAIELDTPGQRLAGYTVETFYP